MRTWTRAVLKFGVFGLGALGFVGCESSVTWVGPGRDGGNDTSDTGTDEVRWTCDNRAIDGTCDSFTGVGWDRPSVDAWCDGEVRETACPDADLGSCRKDVDLPLEYVESYYVGDYYGADDQSLVRQYCELEFGIWIPN
jgi:hypothetical protein